MTLQNINFLAGNDKYSRIAGYDATHTVENVLIENLNMFGTKASNLDEAKIKISADTVSNVEVR